MPSLDELYRAAIRAHQTGHTKDAARLYDDILARKPDHAGALQTGPGGNTVRRRVLALTLQQVSAVDGGGGDSDEHFAGAGYRVVDLGPGEDVGLAEGGKSDCVHAVNLASGTLNAGVILGGLA